MPEPLPLPAPEPEDPDTVPETVVVHRLEVDIAPGAILKILGTLLGLWALSRVFDILVWLVIALMLVCVLHPAVKKLQGRLSRSWAITGVVVSVVLGVAALAALVVPAISRQVHTISSNLPRYLPQVEELAHRFNLNVDLAALGGQWSGRAAQPLLTVSLQALNVLAGSAGVVILTVFLLIDGPKVANALLSLFPRTERLPLRRMFGEIGEQVGQYLRGQMLICSLAALFCFVYLTVLRVPEPLALASVIGAASLVPLVGPLAGIAIAAVFALSLGVPTALLTVAGYLAYQQVEGNLIVPRVHGERLKLSPFVVVLAFMLGGALLGILGLFLALPVAAAIPIVSRYVGEWQARETAAEA
jgi:predicted PurR-regulated permease PerM